MVTPARVRAGWPAVVAVAGGIQDVGDVLVVPAVSKATAALTAVLGPGGLARPSQLATGRSYGAVARWPVLLIGVGEYLPVLGIRDPRDR